MASVADISGLVAWYALSLDAVIGASVRLARRVVPPRKKRLVHTNLSWVVSGALVVHVTAALLGEEVSLGLGLFAGALAAVPVVLITVFQARKTSRWWKWAHRTMLGAVALGTLHALLVGPNVQKFWAMIPAVVVLTVLVNVLVARHYKSTEPRPPKGAPRETSPAVVTLPTRRRRGRYRPRHARR